MVRADQVDEMPIERADRVWLAVIQEHGCKARALRTGWAQVLDEWTVDGVLHAEWVELRLLKGPVLTWLGY